MRPADRAPAGRRPLGGDASHGASRGPAGGDHVLFLVIGRVAAPRGVRGELRVNIETDAPERFGDLERVLLGEDHVPFRVESAQVHRGQALLTLEGIEDRDAAEAWRGAYVYVLSDDALPLEEGEYYHHQIVGLEVVTEDDEALGRVTEILSTGANDVYVVQGRRGEVLLPALEGVILRVDLASGRMHVRVPEGLL